MVQVNTVLGPVDAAGLGFTLSHEHVTVVYGAGLRENWPFLFDWEATRAKAARHLAEAKAGGIDTIIDLSTIDLGRDVDLFAQVARDSGMNIVCATGIWRDPPRLFWNAEPSYIAKVFIHEIEQGIGPNAIKPGVIKVANDAEGITPIAERVLAGAAIACKETGVPVSSHHWAPLHVGLRQLEVLLEAGAPPHLVCIGHSADSTNVEYLESLLRYGVYLSMDRYPGAAGRPNWQQRNATVTALVQRGWASKLMLGHDYGVRPVMPGIVNDPDPDTHPTRYLHLKQVAIPDLLARGVTEAQIREMTVDVPRRFLTGEK